MAPRQRLFVVNGTGAKFMLRKHWKRFSESKHGATAIEYGLIAAGIAVVIAGSIALLGPRLKTTFGTITKALTG